MSHITDRLMLKVMRMQLMDDINNRLADKINRRWELYVNEHWEWIRCEMVGISEFDVQIRPEFDNVWVEIIFDWDERKWNKGKGLIMSLGIDPAMVREDLLEVDVADLSKFWGDEAFMKKFMGDMNRIHKKVCNRGGCSRTVSRVSESYFPKAGQETEDMRASRSYY